MDILLCVKHNVIPGRAHKAGSKEPIQSATTK